MFVRSFVVLWQVALFAGSWGVGMGHGAFLLVVHPSVPLCVGGDGFYGVGACLGGSWRGLRPLGALVVSNHSMKIRIIYTPITLCPPWVIFSLFLTD